MRLLERIRDERTLSLVHISYGLAVVRNLCQRVVVTYLGKIVEQAVTRTLFALPPHPYTAALLAGVPSA